MCPEGMEATMFALMAGCENLGRAVATFLGSYILARVGVDPDGTDDESQFAGFWQAAAIQAIAPLLMLVLLPIMIPDALQTDRIRRPHADSMLDGGSGGSGEDPGNSDFGWATRDSWWRTHRFKKDALSQSSKILYGATESSSGGGTGSAGISPAEDAGRAGEGEEYM